MTVLDRAFVKAYARQGRPQPPASPACAAPDPREEQESRPSDDVRTPQLPAGEKEVDTVAEQVGTSPGTNLGEAVETWTRSSDGHPHRKAGKNGHARHGSHSHSRKRMERRAKDAAESQEHPTPVSRPSLTANETAGAAPEAARKAVLLATKEAPSITREMTDNGVSLAAKSTFRPKDKAKAAESVAPAGKELASPKPESTTAASQEMAINGVSLQVRSPSSLPTKSERLSLADVPSPTRPLPAASRPKSADGEPKLEEPDAGSAKAAVLTPESPATQPQGEPESASAKPPRPSQRQLKRPPPTDDAAEPPSKPFRPLLEVDRFVWPSDCDQLARRAADQLDALADQIAEEARQGRNAVGVASCRRGDGCTSLVLAIAPRLVALGLKTLLVDSDFHNPVLGRRLGLLPENGWEEVLSGRLPLEEVIVESLQDRLAVLPLKEPPPGRSYELGGSPQPQASLQQLARQYELLLIDVGRFHRHDAKDGNLPRPDAGWLDSLVLLHNVRSTPQEDLARNRQRVRDAGIHEMGIVENFA